MQENIKTLQSLLTHLKTAPGVTLPDESEEILSEIIDSAMRLKRSIRASRRRGSDEMSDRYKEALHQALIRQSLMGIAIIENEHFVYVNQRLCQMFGYSVDEFLTLTPMDLAAPEDRKLVADSLRRKRPQKSEAELYRVRALHKNGTELITEVFGAADTANGSIISIIVEDVTEREKSQDHLIEKTQRLRAVLESSLVGIVIARMGSGQIDDVNDHFMKLSGYTRDDMIGHTTVELGLWAKPEQRDQLLSTLEKGQSLHGMQATMRKKDGELCEVLLSATSTSLRGNRYSVVSIMDITELLSARQAVEQQKGRMQAIIDLHPSGIAMFDSERKLVLWNRRYAELLQYPETLLNRTHVLLDDMIRFNHSRGDYPDKSEEEALDVCLGHFSQGESVHFSRERRGDRTFKIDGIPLPGDEALIIYTDITHLSQAEEHMRILANHDPLTQLPNRRHLMDVLRYILAGKRERHTALLLLDLDNFKPLNDQFGHQAGDRFLVWIAERLVGTVRGSDVVARIGGDEFVVVLTGLNADREMATTEAMNIANKIRTAIHEPYSLPLNDNREETHHEHQSSCSIGIRLFGQEDKADADTLIQQADEAMYSAKHAGKNRIAFYGNT